MLLDSVLESISGTKVCVCADDGRGAEGRRCSLDAESYARLLRTLADRPAWKLFVTENQRPCMGKDLAGPGRTFDNLDSTALPSSAVCEQKYSESRCGKDHVLTIAR